MPQHITISKRQENRWKKFIDTQLELIDEYECSGKYIDEHKYEILSIVDSIQKMSKQANFQQVLIQALQWAIRYDEEFLAGVRHMRGEYEKAGDEYNSLQSYFDEIGNIYRKNKDNFDIEYSAETRDDLLEMNLKMVISIAKRYQGLGLSMQELVSAGNVGLIQAWEKFDPKRTQLKERFTEAMDSLVWPAKKEDILASLEGVLKYGTVLQNFTATLREEDNDYTEVMEWVNKNIKNAKFSSIAVMWIKAAILGDIDEYSRVVKKPKSEIYKDRQENGSYKKEITIDIDQPISSEFYNNVGDSLEIFDPSITDLEAEDALAEHRNIMKKLMTGIDQREQSIIFKKFGIGYPQAMTPREIATMEGITIARVSQISNACLQKMRENAILYHIDPEAAMAVCSKLR